MHLELSWTEFAESKDGEYVAKTINLVKLFGSDENHKVEFNGSEDVGYWEYSGVIFGHEDGESADFEHVMLIEFGSKRHALIEIGDDLYELLPSDHIIYKRDANWRTFSSQVVHQNENLIMMQLLKGPCPSELPKKRVWMELTKQREDLTKNAKRRRQV